MDDESSGEVRRVDFDRRLMLQFRGAVGASNAGQMAYPGEALADALSGWDGRLALAGFSGKTACAPAGVPTPSAYEFGRRVFDLRQSHAQAIGDALKAVKGHSAELINRNTPPSPPPIMAVRSGGAPALATSSKRIAASTSRIGGSGAELGSGDRRGGRYPSDWEPLPDAVDRIMASGMKESEAKLDLCRAISDRKIKVRFCVEKEEGGGFSFEAVEGTVRKGRDVDIPSHLTPRDFDWPRSRPLKPWRDIRWRFDPFAGEWRLKWIEVFRADVTRVLCGAENGGESPNTHGAAPQPAPRSNGRGQPALERARGIIEELYPDGVPGQAAVPNTILCRRVSAKLKESKLPHVSDDTILRAAARRN